MVSPHALELEKVSIMLSSIIEMQEYYPGAMGQRDRKELVEEAVLEETLKSIPINSTSYAK